MRHALTALSAVAAGLALQGCVWVHAKDNTFDQGGRRNDDGSLAKAHIEGRSGSSLTGWATLTERDGGVLVEITVDHAPPGWHAAHIHEVGDCSAADGKSAGGHFNPAGYAHGSPHAAEHHAGDLGNMWVDENGRGHHAIFMPELTLDSGSHAVRDRAIIIHEAADDLVSQPTGAAGGRIGCGVIR